MRLLTAPALSSGVPGATEASDSPPVHRAGDGPHITRGQLLDLATRFAATLRASGIKPGDTVNIADVNTVRPFAPGMLQKIAAIGVRN